MNAFKVYMPGGSSGNYHLLGEQLKVEQVAFGTDPDSYRKLIGSLYWLKKGKSYAVFSGPDDLTEASFRKYGMKAIAVDAGDF